MTQPSPESGLGAQLRELTHHLSQALRERAVIDQATGVLMARQHLTFTDAKAALLQMAHEQGVRLGVVARTLLDAPDRGD